MFYYLIHSSLNEISAIFRVGGPDANTYLQGQFTQELNRPTGSVSYGLFLNHKGKVVADGYVLKLANDDFWLVSFSSSAAKLRERLEAYLIADEVTINDETGHWVRISLWGVEAGMAVTKLIGQLPLPGNWSEGGEIRVFRGRGGFEENLELLVPVANASVIGAELRAMRGCEADIGVVERERITKGIPSVPADIGVNDLPNEGGLEEVAISYTKGCYLGQEVMARLKNLGQVRRRLHVLRGAGQSPAFGSPLFQGDKRVGEIRSTARDGDDFVALAMLSLVNLTPTVPLGLIPNGKANIGITRRV